MFCSDQQTRSSISKAEPVAVKEEGKEELRNALGVGDSFVTDEEVEIFDAPLASEVRGLRRYGRSSSCRIGIGTGNESVGFRP